MATKKKNLKQRIQMQNMIIIALAVINSDDKEKLAELRQRSQKLCDKYPLY